MRDERLEMVKTRRFVEASCGGSKTAMYLTVNIFTLLHRYQHQ
jgi:hypothetical protein